MSPISHDGGQILIDFGRHLVSAGVIDEITLDRAIRAAVTTDSRLDKTLLALGMIPEVRLCAEIAQFLDVKLAGPEDIPPEPVDRDIIGEQFVRARRILPLALSESRLSIAEVDPFDNEPRDALVYLLGLPVESLLISETAFHRAILDLYGETAGGETGEPLSRGANEADVERLRDMANDAPIVRLVNEILVEAIDTKASDVHFEPTEDAFAVRYRIDGRLQTKRSLAQSLQAATTSRIKIMAKMDIAERRLPQDGRIKFAARGVDIDLRVSTLATSFGESIVLRILDRSRVELDFSKLGFEHAESAAIERLIRQPNGIFLVTGPTGSGKTTTLYTALSAINQPDAKIFTVEDPVEYQLPGINQVQIHAEIGLDFPQVLRSILRQDPDIIMIGEIRDVETARIAIQASLTGHLVLSTLHTNNASSTVTRLIDMGIEPHLLGSTLNGVLAQRLVRRLCPKCATAHPEQSLWEERIHIELDHICPPHPPQIRAASGCDACFQTGYSGRAAIAELLTVKEDLRTTILSFSPENELHALARRAGMITLYESGLQMVWNGITTIEEVFDNVKGVV